MTRRLITEFARRPPQITPQPLPGLTPRETEVLIQVARGLSNREIAGQLFLGEATIKTYVGNILMKLGCRDRIQAVAAYEAGLVQPRHHLLQHQPPAGRQAIGRQCLRSQGHRAPSGSLQRQAHNIPDRHGRHPAPTRHRSHPERLRAFSRIRQAIHDLLAGATLAWHRLAEDKALQMAICSRSSACDSARPSGHGSRSSRLPLP